MNEVEKVNQKSIFRITVTQLTEQHGHCLALLHHSVECLFVNIFNFIVFQVTKQPVQNLIFIHQVTFINSRLMFVKEDYCRQLVWGNYSFQCHNSCFYLIRPTRVLLTSFTLCSLAACLSSVLTNWMPCLSQSSSIFSSSSMTLSDSSLSFWTAKWFRDKFHPQRTQEVSFKIPYKRQQRDCQCSEWAFLASWPTLLRWHLCRHL